MNVIDSILEFRPKDLPGGMVMRFKAKFCAREDQKLHLIEF